MYKPLSFIKTSIKWVHGALFQLFLPALIRPPRIIYKGSLESTNRVEIEKFLESWRAHIHGKVLDVGVGDWEYPRFLFKNLCEYTATDCIQHMNVDIVSDIHALTETFPEGGFDFVICTDVLEHVARPWIAVRQLRAVLKPDGILLLTVPFNYNLHGTQEMQDYWRFTEDGLRLLLVKEAGFGKITITPGGHIKFPFSYTVVAQR